MPKVLRLSVDEVLHIRRLMSNMDVAKRGAFGSDKPLSQGAIEMAVNRQSTGTGSRYKYNTISQVGATLFYGITLGHAFENGNKRTAFVSLLIFFDKNKTVFVDVTENELYNLAREVAAHEIPVKGKRTSDSEVVYISSWIRERSRSIILGDLNTIKFQDLKKILEAQGCEFEDPSQNFIKIKRDTHSYQIGYPKNNFDVNISTIKAIRRALHLDQVHGIDSSRFYNLEGRVDFFVNEYSVLLQRLADL